MGERESPGRTNTRMVWSGHGKEGGGRVSSEVHLIASGDRRLVLLTAEGALSLASVLGVQEAAGRDLRAKVGGSGRDGAGERVSGKESGLGRLAHPVHAISSGRPDTQENALCEAHLLGEV